MGRVVRSINEKTRSFVSKTLIYLSLSLPPVRKYFAQSVAEAEDRGLMTGLQYSLKDWHSVIVDTILESGRGNDTRGDYL